MREIALDFGYIICEYNLTCIIDTRKNMSFGNFFTCMFCNFKIPIMGIDVLNSAFMHS